jgi:hypothetical protein
MRAASEDVRELGFLYSGDLTPISGVYKGVHRCGRNCCYFVTCAERLLPTCVDCGLIRFSLFAISPSADEPELQSKRAARFL